MGFRSPEPLSHAHDLDAFGCDEPALDDWLHKHAQASQAGGWARVFVSLAESGRVAGYYALAAAQVEPKDATDRLMKGQARSRPVPTVLLARLAVDREFQRQGPGASLLRDAMLRSLGAAEAVGIRAMIVHARTRPSERGTSSTGSRHLPPIHST